MEIAGYSILSWIILFVGVGVAGWATSFPLVWLLTLRTDGEEPSPDNPLIRYQWVIGLALAVTYFIVLGNAVDWQVGASD